MTRGCAPDEIRARLEGPVNSIATPFTREGEVDWSGVRNIVEAGIRGGSGVSLLTYGDGNLGVLSDGELAELTRVVVRQAAGRSLVVAATRRGWTRETVAFAEFCRDLGADVLMMLPGESMMGSPGLPDYYRAVAAVMPVMLVGCPDHGLLDRLVDEPGICCFKEDGSEAYAVRTIRRYGDRWKFVTGGQLWRHFTQWPFGCRAFMSCHCACAPEVNDRYWRALLANDLETAGRVVAGVDVPFFDLEEAFPGGIQAAWRGMLELNGIALRYRRPPMPSLADPDMDRLKEALARIGLPAGR
jgi:4-hydroxy-tetrahydrodipicolinate synthase